MRELRIGMIGHRIRGELRQFVVGVERRADGELHRRIFLDGNRFVMRRFSYGAHGTASLVTLCGTRGGFDVSLNDDIFYRSASAHRGQVA